MCRYLRRYCSTLLLAVTALTSSCGSSDNGALEQMEVAENKPSTDLATLGRLINMPIVPTAARWQTNSLVTAPSPAPGPNDWGLVAVLEMDEDELSQLLAKSSATGQMSLPESLVSPWVREKLGSKLERDASGGYFRVEGQALEAGSFTKSPLLKGSIVPVSSNELLVFLYTM